MNIVRSTLIDVPHSQACFGLFQVITEEQNTAFSDLFDALRLPEPQEEDETPEDIARFRRIFVKQHVTLEEDGDATTIEPVQDDTDVQDLKAGEPNDDLVVKHEPLPVRDHSNGSEELGKYEEISHQSTDALRVTSMTPVALEVTSMQSTETDPNASSATPGERGETVAVTERLQDDIGKLGLPSVEIDEDMHDQDVKHLEWKLFNENEERSQLEETSPQPTIHSTPAAKTSRTSGTHTAVSDTTGHLFAGDLTAVSRS